MHPCVISIEYSYKHVGKNHVKAVTPYRLESCPRYYSIDSPNREFVVSSAMDSLNIYPVLWIVSMATSMDIQI